MIKSSNIILNNILLTGGAGYIGSHISVYLIKKGFNVTIFDSFINSRRFILEKIKNLIKIQNSKNLKNLETVEGDIRDLNSLRKLFDRSKQNKKPFNAVIHLAGLKQVANSVNKPLEYWENNVFGSINLLKVMDENNCRTIIFSSSATIYEKSSAANIKESFSINPTNPYGSTKAAVEKMLMDVFESRPNEWGIINLRYFNPIGADPSGLLGEQPKNNPSNIFPIILDVASNKSKQLNIYGNDWETADGTAVRDYIHISDLSNGHIKALEFLKNNKPQYLNLNLGTGLGTSVLELIKTFENSNKVEVPYVYAKRRLGDVSYAVADNSLAKDVLDWIPQKNLSEMCVDGWRWQTNLINNSELKK